MQEFILEGNKRDLIRDYDNLLTQYVMVLYDSGLSKADCVELGKIILNLLKMKESFEANLKKEKADLNFYETNHEIYKLFAQKTIDVMNSEVLELEENIKDLDKLIWDYENVYQSLKKEMRPSGITEFIRDEVSLFHLVYTNKEQSLIKLCSVGSFKCLCQFHKERTPSLFVNEGTNSLFCYGCGITVDAIEYLKIYENISTSKAVSLLAKVYLLNIGKHTINASADLVDKYRSSLLSDEYRILLEQGYERVCGYEDSIKRSRAMFKFEKDMETIERVKRGDWERFEVDDGMKLVLKRPGFEEE